MAESKFPGYHRVHVGIPCALACTWSGTSENVSRSSYRDLPIHWKNPQSGSCSWSRFEVKWWTCAPFKMMLGNRLDTKWEDHIVSFDTKTSGNFRISLFRVTIAGWGWCEEGCWTERTRWPPQSLVLYLATCKGLFRVSSTKLDYLLRGLKIGTALSCIGYHTLQISTHGLLTVAILYGVRPLRGESFMHSILILSMTGRIQTTLAHVQMRLGEKSDAAGIMEILARFRAFPFMFGK